MSRIVCAHVLRMRGRLEFLYPKPCLWNAAVWERCVQHHGLGYWVGVFPPPFLFFSRLGRNEYHGWEFKGQQTNQNISVYIDISLYIFFYIYEFHIQFLSFYNIFNNSRLKSLWFWHCLQMQNESWVSSASWRSRETEVKTTKNLKIRQTEGKSDKSSDKILKEMSRQKVSRHARESLSRSSLM